MPFMVVWPETVSAVTDVVAKIELPLVFKAASKVEPVAVKPVTVVVAKVDVPFTVSVPVKVGLLVMVISATLQRMLPRSLTRWLPIGQFISLGLLPDITLVPILLR